MKFKKILLILGIIALLSTLAMSTSFAASNEKITKWKMHATDTYSKKIVTIDETYVMDDDYNSKSIYKIKINKKYQNKFKIKSVNITYKYYGEDYELDETIHKIYNGKNKNSITIKDPMKNLNLERIVIEYYTKFKPKIESTNLLMNFNWKSTTQYYGKKSNIKVFEKGYNKVSSSLLIESTINYQKFKIITKNKKDKLKTVQVIYNDPNGINSVKNYKGYGKNNLALNQIKS